MDDSDEFSDATLRRMVRELRPSWTLRAATPAEEGTDAVYFLTVETPDGPRECVLKVCAFVDPEAFRPEPHLLALADRRTAIPVASVLGVADEHADLPAPFFLMEHREGEVRENEARELPADAVTSLAREAGRNLGELHALGEFEAFGPVRLARDADRDRGGLAVGDRRLTVGAPAADAWQTRFERIAAADLDDLHDRFADLEADLRAFAESRFDALDRGFDPVLGHDDYRLGNLLVDPEAGETTAVLDWGNAHTVEAQYNLALTEQYFSGWARRDDPLRERVRKALREGYAETNRLEPDAAFERRWELYLGVTRLFPLVWFSLWYGDADEDERDRIAAKHREAVRELLD
ncbi:aminoglycoside phosphotransferase [Halobacteriales archaeon QS_1_67_19]|nr:MAG: aminoglycoside phosphotransferase [Halobacteriales archaeon QS_1_67_19]